VANQNKLYRLLKLIALLKQEPSKSAAYIAKYLDSSHRTVYRYIELLQSVGFNVEVDKFKKYSIQNNQLLTPSHFNIEELDFLKELLLTSASANKLSQSIIHKLSLNSDIELVNHDIYNAQLSRFISVINKAIHTDKQILIKQYQSINSQKVSDRVLEPIKFTSNYQSLCAFEIKQQQNKFFNIERMGDVVIKDIAQSHQHLHQFSKPDVFGFSRNDKTYQINLLLNLKAKLLLTEEYPLTHSFIDVKGKNKYLFSTIINNPKPIQRFYKGLKGDIEVLAGTEVDLKNSN